MFQGLNTQAVEESRLTYGENDIVEAEPETLIEKKKRQLENPKIRFLKLNAMVMGV